MLENARRQLFLILAMTVVSIVLVCATKLKLGPDLRGGTELIYEVDFESEVSQGNLAKMPSEDEINAIMTESVAVIAERIDPTGVLEAVVVRRGRAGLLIELPAMAKIDLDAVAQRVSELGRLEMRIVASNLYNKDGVRIDLPSQRKRLEDWLKEGDNRAMVAKDPTKIVQFNTQQADPNVRWYPQRIRPKPDATGQWDNAAMFALQDRDAVVPAFEMTDWNSGAVLPGKEFLVAYYAVNMHERFFTGEDLDAAGVHPTVNDDDGRPAIAYQIKNAIADQYADWSEEFIQQRSAIILNGFVESAPTFISRIPGAGIITGHFTPTEASELVKVLKTGSLKVHPVETSRRTIGASLGQHAIDLGMWSMAIGAFLVFAFILAYYRLAGVVASLAIGVNILMIFAALSFIDATLTLPGIAGLVLTMGMAVDANILIYERIREELARGKELVQAVRAGFDRAIVTILDSNITTFLAGLVLYNVGVGPIRGFAVTLMIGIVTTVFTAFYVSRVMFHFLLEWGWLKKFRTVAWLADVKVDLLRYSPAAITLSLVVIIGGLVAFAVVPPSTKLGLDFTGGAKLQVVLREPQTVIEVQERVAGSDFERAYPGWAINTVGEADASQRAHAFNVKLKLSSDQRAEITAARLAAATQQVAFKPPYTAMLEQALGDLLVRRAFESAYVTPDPERPARQFAAIEAHFLKDVKLDELRTALAAAYGEDPEQPNKVSALAGTAETAKDVRLEYNVDAGVTPAQLGTQLSEKLQASLKSADGSPIALSDPIPESEEIGGRMVGELKNAAIGSLIIALFLTVMYIRVRFHEYKYGIAALVALVHDVLVTLGVVVVANAMGWVSAELDLGMIAAFLTIIGYSINDTIVIFDRVRENLAEQKKLGERIEHRKLMSLSINQTLSRTFLTSATVLFVVLAQFIVNYDSGSSLEGFSFAMVVGLFAGTYSTVFIATPIVLWMHNWRPKPPTGATAKAAA